MTSVHEPRHAFHGELAGIMRDITRLAAYVTEAIPRGTDALLANDLQSAQELIDQDDVVDRLAIETEERCYTALALQAPVAGDLRAVITAIRLISEIERSMDLMVNVCKATRRIYPSELPPTVRGLLQEMCEEATQLFRMCMDAYVEGDTGLAAALDDVDDRLDHLHADFMHEVLAWGGGDIRGAVQLALIGRYYERIGDHAVNIGRRVRYMVDGLLPAPPAGSAIQHALPEQSGIEPSIAPEFGSK